MQETGFTQNMTGNGRTNVPLRHVCIITAACVTNASVALVIQYVQCACIVLYCNLWPLWLYHIFPNYLFKWYDFWKKKY